MPSSTIEFRWFFSFFTSMNPALLIISTVDSDEAVASRPNDNPGWAVHVDLIFLQSNSYDALQGKRVGGVLLAYAYE